MSERPSSKELPQFNAPPPPPPPPAPFEDARSMGLATEVVFSGQRRQELRDALRSTESASPQPPNTAQRTDTGVPDMRQERFDDTQPDENLTLSEQPSALTTYLLMSLMGLGVLVILVLLMYQVILG